MSKTKCKASFAISISYCVHGYCSCGRLNGYHVLCRYNFKSDPRAVGAIVMLSANESSYTGPLEGMSSALTVTPEFAC